MGVVHVRDAVLIEEGEYARQAVERASGSADRYLSDPYRVGGPVEDDDDARRGAA